MSFARACTRTLLALFGASAFGSACGSDALGVTLQQQSQSSAAILQGALHPDAQQGFDDAAENANVIVTHGGADCSGTLIADRVVLTAFHCIIDNVRDWYLGDGDVLPLLSPVGSFSVVIGSARSDALCTFDVAAVQGHPLALPNTPGNVIDNDVAVLTLATSVIASCPHARTIPLADGVIGTVNVGDHVVVAGFGATDEEFRHLNERRWAELEVTIANPLRTNFSGIDIGSGLPAPGDSGGGVFVASDDGPILAGISSTVAQPYLSAIKVADFQDFVVETAGEAWTSCEVSTACLNEHTQLQCQQGPVRSVACADDVLCASTDDAGGACSDAPLVNDQAEVAPAFGCAQTSADPSIVLALALAVLARARLRPRPS